MQTSMPIRLTQTVKVLLITCFTVFVLQQTGDQFFGAEIMSLFGLNSVAFFHQHRFWQLLTYSFFHPDVMHLFFNLMMLAFIGGELEAAWGTARFIRFYASCAIGSGVVYLLLDLSFGHGSGHSTMVGATGAIYGLLMAYGLTFGERVLLFMMLFPMKAKHFIWILALLELMTTVYSGGGGGLASLGHLAGMGIGFGFLWIRTLVILSKKNQQKQGFRLGSKKRRNQHLKLIVNNEQDFDSQDRDSEDNPRTWH